METNLRKELVNYHQTKNDYVIMKNQMGRGLNIIIDHTGGGTKRKNKYIYIIRHGETQWNIEKRSQGGEADISLNDVGKEQAKITGMYLKKYRSKKNFDCIYTSPLIRASETAEIIKNELDESLPIIILDDLREHNVGKSSGKTQKEQKDDPTFDNFYKILQKQTNIKDPINKALYNKKVNKEVVKLGAESYTAGINRAKKVFDAILTSPYNKIIMITHSGTMWEMLFYLTHYGENTSGKNCSICYVEYKDENYEIITMPNDDHIKLMKSHSI